MDKKRYRLLTYDRQQKYITSIETYLPYYIGGEEYDAPVSIYLLNVYPDGDGIEMWTTYEIHKYAEVTDDIQYYDSDEYVLTCGQMIEIFAEEEERFIQEFIKKLQRI